MIETMNIKLTENISDYDKFEGYGCVIKENPIIYLRDKKDYFFGTTEEIGKNIFQQYFQQKIKPVFAIELYEGEFPKSEYKNLKGFYGGYTTTPTNAEKIKKELTNVLDKLWNEYVNKEYYQDGAGI